MPTFSYVRITKNPKILFMNAIQRLWSTLPFVIALAVLIFLGWSASLGLDYPYDGIVQSDPYGVIQVIDPAGPTAGLLKIGDQIVSIDGVPWNEARPLYANNQVGDVVNLVVLEDGEQIFVEFQLVEHFLPWLPARLPDWQLITMSS